MKIKIIKDEESGTYTAYSDELPVIVSGNSPMEAIEKFKKGAMLCVSVEKLMRYTEASKSGVDMSLHKW